MAVRVIVMKQGTTDELQSQPLMDGLLSFTTDDGKIHLDYVNKSTGDLQRLTFYGGRLKIGPHIYDGSNDVDVNEYEGQMTIDP